MNSPYRGKPTWHRSFDMISLESKHYSDKGKLVWIARLESILKILEACLVFSWGSVSFNNTLRGIPKISGLSQGCRVIFRILTFWESSCNFKSILGIHKLFSEFLNYLGLPGESKNFQRIFEISRMFRNALGMPVIFLRLS